MNILRVKTPEGGIYAVRGGETAFAPGERIVVRLDYGIDTAMTVSSSPAPALLRPAAKKEG